MFKQNSAFSWKSHCLAPLCIAILKTVADTYAPYDEYYSAFEVLCQQIFLLNRFLGRYGSERSRTNKSALASEVRCEGVLAFAARFDRCQSLLFDLPIFRSTAPWAGTSTAYWPSEAPTFLCIQRSRTGWLPLTPRSDHFAVIFCA